MYNNGKFHFVTSFHILEYDDCNIELIEEVEFDDKKELIKRERYHIENNINCVNKRVEGRTRKEYNEQNREKISERAKQWYLVNKDKIKEKVEQNKEKLLERRKQKITCDCGCVVRKSDIRRHEKSIKHQNYLKTIV